MAVTKIIELVGSSKTSSDDAVRQALAEAQKTLRNIKAVDVVSTGLRGDSLDEWRARVRLVRAADLREVRPRLVRIDQLDAGDGQPAVQLVELLARQSLAVLLRL